MSAAQIIDSLNRLLAIHIESLSIYLADADPWTQRADDRAAVVLHNIVADQRELAKRIGQAIIELRGQPESADFPMAFTDMNCLSLDYLLSELVRYQQQDIASIERLLPELSADLEAYALGEEALGAARAHLEQLEELSHVAAG